MSANKIKICTVICDITSGGVESVLQNYFSHIDRSKYELDLVTYGVQSSICEQKFQQLGFRIIEIPPKRQGFFKSLKAMNRVIKEGNYDVIHAHLTEWNCLPLFLGKINKVKCRISHSHMAEVSISKIKQLLLRIQRSVILKNATQLCACGVDAGKYLYGEDVFNKGKVKVLNNAIDRNRFQPDAVVREQVREELRISESTLCVGHIGRFLPQKNHTFLIEIFKDVVNRNPDSVLLLVGTGELENSIREKCDQLHITDKVQFLGIRPDPERLYQAMDVFCLPSLFEGLPVVGIEVQASQTPAILSDKITEKVKLTDYIFFQSLECSSEDWADKIIKLKEFKGKASFPDEYDIAYMSREWEKLYRIDGNME